MQNDWLQRTEVLLGKSALEKLAASRVAVIGLGGVGSAAAEAICRSGVGHLLLIDGDVVSDSNRNRQLLATVDSVGMGKAMVCAARLNSINPACDVLPLCLRLTPDNLHEVFGWKPDCVIDAIDTVTVKIALTVRCRDEKVPLYMSMGTGGRLDPTQLRIGSLEDTRGTGCSLARVMRRLLKNEESRPAGVVYSLEPPNRAIVASDVAGRHPPSSSAFVPPAAGFALASMAVRRLTSDGYFWDKMPPADSQNSKV